MALQTPALARRSALANVEAALAWWGTPADQRRERALAALEQVGVDGLAERPAATLSGGEARRVHLARVLALDPDVLLLDEPFAGLDTAARGDLLYDTRELLRSPGRATVIVLHDRAEAWALADRTALILGGRIVAEGDDARGARPPAHAGGGDLPRLRRQDPGERRRPPDPPLRRAPRPAGPAHGHGRAVRPDRIRDAARAVTPGRAPGRPRATRSTTSRATASARGSRAGSSSPCGPRAPSGGRS